MKQKEEITINLTSGKFLNLLYALLIFFAGLILYSKSASFGLIFADDNQIVAFAYSEEFKTERMIDQFSKSTGNAFYRPLLDISFMIDGSVIENRIEPLSFHRTNIILHIAAVLIAFFTFMRLGFKSTLSLFAALIYLVHPLLTPAVSWVSGRNDSLLAVFILPALFFFSLFCEKKGIMKQIYLLVHFLFFLLALLTKESAALLPFAVFLYVKMARKEPFFAKRNMQVIIGWLVILAVWLILRVNALDGGSFQNISIENFFLNFPAFFAILGKFILPVNLAATSYFTAVNILSGVLVCGALAAVYFLRKKMDGSYFVFGLMWFILFLFATMFFRLPEEIAYFDYMEHRAYLPLFGLLVSLMVSAESFGLDFRKLSTGGTAAGIVLVLSVISFLYQDIYTGRKTYWSRIAEINPGEPRAYYNIGAAFVNDNKLDTAEILLKKSIALDSSMIIVYRDLAHIYLKRQNWRRAKEYAGNLLKKDTSDPLIYFYYGKAELNLQNYRKAAFYFTKAEQLGYMPASMFVDMGYAYAKLYMPDEAIESYEKALKLNPASINALCNLGDLYLEWSRFEEAEKSYQKALSVNNRAVQAYNGLINVHIAQEQWNKALFYANKFRNIGGSLNPSLMKLLNEKLAAQN